MNSIINKIIIIKDESKESLNKNIAVQLFENFLQKKFLSSKKMAAKLFISQATLTKFAKKVDCKGYNEVILRLQVECENVKPSYVSEVHDLSTLNDLLKNTIADLDKVMGDIEKLAKKIKSAQTVHIASAHNSWNEAQFFHSLIVKHQENTRIYNPSFFGDDTTYKINANDLVILFVSGNENASAQKLFETAKKTKNAQTAVFVSSKMGGKFQEADFIITASSSLLSSNLLYWKIILDYIFAVIEIFFKT
ncbi:MurR/RpiR family transcriptional regulator [Mesoplasma syrphidae]|uniref:MurR/RpiR family transcriptional regulator n=1 Tax=Mesoplasma syrphidae TaxID=225999 RepID=A0A2K9BTZ7_9MOLU|nr:helix-turn-helix domain-containing protein [Mesoplasma syrphidae]AUF83200.1 MurR/RpiR family transcriptional regulator [Mesoplasma syrphidae]